VKEERRREDESPVLWWEKLFGIRRAAGAQSAVLSLVSFAKKNASRIKN
jgi:hypothetical protein